MITVQRIELVNFRSISYALIEPTLDGGMTALAGANGTGKTSVVHGIAWAMYGITPPDVSVKGLRRQGSDPAAGEECRVTVTFTHDGQTIEATRALKGKNDTTVAYIKVDGVEITNVSAKTAVAWMEKRLGGLDAAGFLTAFIVRQKELDDLVKARPAERKKLIERLAGIERMADAVQRAREAETDARKFSLMLPGSPEEVAEAESNAATALTMHTDAVAAAHEYAVALESSRADFTTAQDLAQELGSKADKEAALKRSRDEQAAALNLRKQDLGYAQLALQGQEEAALGGDPESVTAAEQTFTDAQSQYVQIRDAQQQAATLTGRVEALTDSRNRAAADLEGAQENLTSARSTYMATEAVYAAMAKPSDEDIAAAQKKVDDAAAIRGDHQAEYRRLTTAITVLTDSTHPACPTCNRDLEDSDAVISGLRTAVDVVTRAGTEATAAWEAAKAALTSLTVQRDEAAEFARRLQRDADRLATAEKAHEQASRDAQKAEEALTAAVADRQRLTEAGDPEALSVAEKALNEARVARDKALAAREASAKVPALQASVDEHSTEVDRLTAVIGDLDSQIDALAVDPNAVRTAIAAANEARDAVQAISADLQAATAQATVAEAAARTAEQAAQSARDRLAAKQEALQALQERTATREALEAFRADRLARLAPELSEVTSDLVSVMSAGRYVAVDMDENFTPILTDDKGMQRPVSYLSGGEESIVALALRLGIGDVISGSRGGLLVLDEVLTAQDPDRRQAMMTAIRELPGRQVIMINHVAEATDIADKGYFFTTDDNGDVVVYQTAEQESAVHIEHALDAV